MAKFGINDILNAKTKAAGQQAQTEGYKEIYLSPYEVKAAQENTHQRLENIEELADSFLHVGQEQPTVLARVNGEYRIIDGHRRNAANILNLERGHKEYEKVLYRFMDMSEARRRHWNCAAVCLRYLTQSLALRWCMSTAALSV